MRNYDRYILCLFVKISNKILIIEFISKYKKSAYPDSISTGSTLRVQWDNPLCLPKSGQHLRANPASTVIREAEISLIMTQEISKAPGHSTCMLNPIA